MSAPTLIVRIACPNCGHKGELEPDEARQVANAMLAAADDFPVTEIVVEEE